MPREPTIELTYADDINGTGFDWENAWLAVGTNGVGANVIDCNNNFEEIIEIDSTGRYGWPDFSRNNELLAIYYREEHETQIWSVGDANGDGWTQWTNATIEDGNAQYIQFGFSFDNQYLAAPMDDTELRWGFYEVGGNESWTEVGSLSTPGDTRAGYFHPNGYFISTQRDGTIRLVEQGTWDVLDTNTEMSSIYRVAPDYSGSNRFLVGASADTENPRMFEITENETLNMINTFDRAGGNPGVGWSHTGTQIYINDGDGDRLHDSTDPYELDDTLSGSLSARANGNYSVDNNWLAVGNSDSGFVRVYDADLAQAPDAPTDLSAVFV